MADFINTVDVIGDEALTNSIIDRSITEYKDDTIGKIRDYTFCNCESLVNVDFPSVTSIGVYAFRRCSALTTVVLRSSIIPTASYGILADTPIASGAGHIYVPRALIESYKAATNWSTYTSQFRVLEDYTVDDTITGEVDTTCINGLQKIVKRTLSGDYVNTTVDAVGNYAFRSCDELVSAKFTNITSVGQSAFYACHKLETLDLSAPTNIGASAFNETCSLTALIIRTESVASLENTSAFTKSYHILGTTNGTYNPTGAKDGYIYVPAALVDSYKAATNWSTYADQFRAIEDYPDICGGE